MYAYLVLTVREENYVLNKQDHSWKKKVVRDLLIAFLRQCHFQDIRSEVKNWDHTAGPNVKEGQGREPDIICTDPYSKTIYIIDVRIAWNISTSGGGDGEYYTRKLAKEAEDFKNLDGLDGGTA
jgi:hypothetical protein